MNNLWYRNPSTGLLETKEFSDRLPYQRYIKTPTADGGTHIELKEFAADSQLSILRIADPVATTLVQGYTNEALVGDKFFPSVRMEKESGRFPAFGQEAFVIPGNIKREVGARVQRVLTQSGYVLMSLSEYALGTAIENRERNEWAGSPDMLLTAKLNTVTQKIALYREKLQMTLLTTSSNYASGNALSGAGKLWASTGNPIADMRQLILTVQKKIGIRPNKVWFSPTAWELAINNDEVKKSLKGLLSFGSVVPGMVTPQMMAVALQVDEVVIPYAVYGTGSDGAPKKTALTTGYLWESVDPCNAGCVYVGKGGGIEPSFGYTWERANSPIVESYYENATKSQVWDYEHFFDPVITLNTAGGLYYSIA